MTWWEIPHNRKVFEEAHRFSPGDSAIVMGYVITQHPDVWKGEDGQFRIDMWREALVVGVARQGDPSEFVKIVVIDNRGQARSGYVGRWTPRSGDAHVTESIKYLAEGEEHAESNEQGIDYQTGRRSGRGDQGQDPADGGDPEPKRLRPYMAGDKTALREILQRVR